MKILVHCDAQTYEPLGVWTVPTTGNPIPTYVDEAARRQGEDRLGVYTPPVDWEDVAETLALSSPYSIWWVLTELPADTAPPAFLERLRLDWAGVKEPTSSSRFQAKARRLRFARGKAPELASRILGVEPQPYEPGQRVSDFTVLLRSPDDQQLAVLVPHGEAAKDIDKALAFGLAFQGDRDLHLVLPEGEREIRGAEAESYASASLLRLAFVVTPVRVWTHDAEGRLTEHPIPPRDQALASTRLDEAIPASSYSLGERESWVASLTERADEELDAAHTNSYLSWHVEGRQALKIERTTAGVRITAGTDYSAHREDKTLAEVITLTQPLTASQQETIWAAVDRTVEERAGGADAENLEHLLQARLDTDEGRAALRLGSRLERELAATRPGQRRAYVDLVGVDERGHIHIIETKLGLNVMLGLQGLDYWMWAVAHRAELAEILRSRGHDVAEEPKILLDYVVGGRTDDGSAADVRYLAPVVEALAGDIRWTIGTVHCWRGDDVTVAWSPARRAPAEPRPPEPPRFARRLEDHLVQMAAPAGGTTRRVFLKEPEQAVIPPARPAYRHLVGTGTAHRFLGHVRSSQLFAVNLFGGLSHDQATAVARHVDPLVVAAERPTLEFIDPLDRLGEATHASPHVTQIDVAIRGQRGDGSTHVLLIEVKLTEDDFGTCSAYHDPKNDRRDLCATSAPFGGDPVGCFKLRNHDREQRRLYDDYLPEWRAFDSACPFRASGYQPMRQAALARMLIEEGEADHASIVLCAHDDHGVIWRRWRQVTGSMHAPTPVQIHELPASRVLSELAPQHASELAARYGLTSRTDSSNARLHDAVAYARSILMRLSGEGSTLEQLSELDREVDPALAVPLAQRLERLAELARATREHQITSAFDSPGARGGEEH